jgi:AcrR family transcriptional regulator
MPARDASSLPDPADGDPQAGRPRPSAAERSALLRRDLMEGELYEKAAQLFAEKGFAGTTLQDIANAMGVSRPSLYHYIKSKDELLERLAQDVTAAAVTIVSEIADDQTLTAPEKLHLTTRRMIEFIAAEPSRFRLLNQSETAMPEHLAATQNRLGRQILKGVIAIIDEGQRAGVFRPVDPRVAALGTIGTWNWVAWWHHGGDVGESAEQLADTAVQGLLARPAASHDTSPAALFALVHENLARLEAVVNPGPTPPV